MKRILALVIALLAVILTFPVSAAEKSIEDMIYEEVIQLVDIKDYPADPTDTEIYLLSLVEHGYTKDGWASDNALYLYLYNPSCKEISNSELNTVQMASSWDEDGKPNGFRKYSLCVEGSALNGLYIRAKVGVSAKTVARVANSKRLYGITEFELLEDSSYSAINATDATAYEVGYSYAFSGYGDSITCERTSYQGVINYGLFYDKDMLDETITNAKYIQPVTSADFVVADFSKEFLVSENDIVSLAKYCQNAEKNSENVYLLRFATSDCYTQDVLQLYPFWKLSVDDLKAWYNDSTGKRVSTKALTFIEEDVYLDFDIISLGFSDDGEDVTTIGVVMSPVDIFPNLEGIQTGPDPIPVPDDDTWKKLLAIILLAVGALGIARLIGKLGEIGQAKTNREIRKYLKNQNKNQNRRR